MGPEYSPSEQKNESFQEVNYSTMTEAEREAEFRRQHQQYINEKMSRKKEAQKQRKVEFGSSSSDDSEQDGPMSNSQKSSKSSKDKNKPKKESDISSSDYPLVKNTQNNQNRKNDPDVQKIPANTLSKKGGEWVKDVLILNNNSLTVLSVPIQMKSFSKIKILAELTQGYDYRIKVNFNEMEILFSPAVANHEEKHNLPINYYIFAKIIQEKLATTGVRLRQNKLQKISGIPESLINNSLIYGKINKKSQVLGKWEQRFIVINKQGLFSYKKFNEKHTMYMATGTIKQMWTRFDIQEQNLVVKVMHNGRKTEFGLPLCQILNKSCWVYHFYGLMGRK